MVLVAGVSHLFAAAFAGAFFAAVFLVAVFADGFAAAAFFVPDFIAVCGFFAAVAFLATGFFAFGPVFTLTFAIIFSLI
jgi:hypothetical protein